MSIQNCIAVKDKAVKLLMVSLASPYDGILGLDGVQIHLKGSDNKVHNVLCILAILEK